MGNRLRTSLHTKKVFDEVKNISSAIVARVGQREATDDATLNSQTYTPTAEDRAQENNNYSTGNNGGGSGSGGPGGSASAGRPVGDGAAGGLRPRIYLTEGRKVTIITHTASVYLFLYYKVY